MLKESDDPLGQRVRRLRLQHALSQIDLAEKAGVSRDAIMRLERGTHVARPSTVRKIAAALGVAPQRLTLGH
jgi:transcriptional regulator with XRE-family HTH domain